MKKNLILMSLLLIAAMLVTGCTPAGPSTQATVPSTGTTAPAVTDPTQATPAPTKATTPTTQPTEPDYPDAPDFVVYDIDGNEVRLSDYLGQPVVLNFWATWCGPCQMEMPEFNKKYLLMGDEVVFLMISVDDTMETAQKFIDKKDYQFPVLHDADQSASIAYQVSAIPATYFINPEGKIVAHWVGTIDATRLNAYIGLITK